MSPSVTVILPAHNEGEGISEVISSILHVPVQGFSVQVYVAEDGSRDDTRERVEGLFPAFPDRLALSPVSGRLGYSEALRRAVSAARTEYLCFMDSDGQLDPTEIQNLWDTLISQGSGICAGYRFPRQDPPQRLLFSKLFYFAYRLAGGPKILDPSSPFVLIHRDSALEIVKTPFHLSYGFWWEFQIRARTLGLTITQVPVTHRLREFGSTQVYTAKKLPGIVASHLRGLIALRREMKSFVATKS